MNLVIQNLDNLGLIAGMLDIAETIARAADTQAHNKNLTFGEAVVCMIVSSLGFVERTLYLYSEYFADKPLGHLSTKTISTRKKQKKDPSDQPQREA